VKFYEMIKTFENAAGKRVNPIVALEVSDDGEWPELQARIDNYCAQHDLSYIAFVPYGPTERGKQRFEEYQAQQARSASPAITLLVIGAVALLGALALQSQAAMADDIYKCADGGSMTYVDATRDMIIRRPSQPDELLPFAGAMSRLSTWSRGGQDAVGEGVAPYAEYWQPAQAPAQVWHELIQGHQVDCREAD